MTEREQIESMAQAIVPVIKEQHDRGKKEILKHTNMIGEWRSKKFEHELTTLRDLVRKQGRLLVVLDSRLRSQAEIISALQRRK